MANFWLIQRGFFKETSTSHTVLDEVVNLDYMGAAEFEWGALPKAYRRMMYHFSEYEVFHTEIYTPEHDELMVFCKTDCVTEVIPAIHQFIEQPYSLKEYSDLEKVPKAKKDDTSYNRRRSNFWWCIDDDSYGDWMAFLQPQSKILIETIQNAHQNWWLTKSPKEREEEYNKALR